MRSKIFSSVTLYFLLIASMGCGMVASERHVSNALKLSQEQKYEHALKEYKLAIASDQNDPVATEGISYLYEEMGEFKKAITSWNNVLRDPTSNKPRISKRIKKLKRAIALEEQADFFIKKGNYLSSAHNFEVIASLDAKYSIYLLKAASYYVKAEKISKAKVLYTNFIKLNQWRGLENPLLNKAKRELEKLG